MARRASRHRLPWLLGPVLGAGLLGLAGGAGAGELAFEVPIGVDFGAPFKAGLSVGLLVGEFSRTPDIMMLEGIDGVLLEGRLGASAGTLALGAASSTERGALGLGVLGELTRTWRGTLGQPWWVPPERTLVGLRVQLAVLLVQVFVGAQWCPCRSKDRLLTLGIGARYAVFSPWLE
jgi:hypothetical protein